MKKLFITFIVVTVFSVASSFAQTTKTVSVELCGASTGIGLKYDQRFSGNTGFGLSVAVAYSKGFDTAIEAGSEWNNLLFPAEINYLTGENNSHFEVGLGMMNGRYHLPGFSWYGYYFYVNLGWRYQKPNGFMFRVGLSPSFGSGNHYVDKSAFYPYIGLGWSF